MTKDDMKALVQRMYSAASAGDFDAVDEIFAPDFHSHPLGTNGRDPVRKGWMAIRARFPELHVTAEDMIVDGDRIAVRGAVRPTPDTADADRSPIMEMIRVADGRIAELWAVANFSWR